MKTGFFFIFWAALLFFHAPEEANATPWSALIQRLMGMQQQENNVDSNAITNAINVSLTA